MKYEKKRKERHFPFNMKRKKKEKKKKDCKEIFKFQINKKKIKSKGERSPREGNAKKKKISKISKMLKHEL